MLEDSGRDVKIVDVTSSKGLPAPIFERATGKPATIISKPETPSFNSYYPSQEMHDAAAAALWNALQSFEGA
jgi:hypothetical protein